MHDARDGTFPTQSLVPGKESLSYNIHSSIGATDEEDGDDDDMLQQRISSMGHYGTRYKNATYSYNYSSYPPHRPLSEQYKLEPIYFGTLRSTPRENSLLSLHEDDQSVQRVPSQNNSDEIGQNIINSQSTSKLKRTHGGNSDNSNVVFHENDESSLERRNPYPVITEPPTPNRTSNVPTRHNQFHNSKYYHLAKSPGMSTKNLKQYSREIVNDWEEDDETTSFNEENKHSNPDFHPSHDGRQYSDLDDYDDEDALSRFIPGNSSHTSGKLRFKQNSQAELDGIDNENSLRSRRRPRRSVVHLYDMVVCSTGCNPLIFKGYGCYCGFLGSGLTVDGIDKCCAKHDWCYHHAKCPPLLTYFVPYYWRCDHGRPQCVTDFRGWKGICGAHLCECDRQFAECLKKFPCPRSRAMCVTSPWRFWQNLLMTPSMRYRYY